MASSFSFDTPEEVMHVLASVRASGISPAQKNQLRDLVLSYTNGGKDPSLKIQIVQQLTQLNITPKDTQTKLSTALPLDFGHSRNAPSFVSTSPVVLRPVSPAAVEPNTEIASEAPVSSNAPQPASKSPVNEIVNPTPAQSATPSPVTPQPITPVSEPETNAQAPISPQTVPESVSSPVQPQPAVTMQVQSDTQESLNQEPAGLQPAAAVPVVTQDPLQRIRQIKSLVNEKVGNPVNLVDIDNTVGREYMSSLLEAMKKVNSGGDAQTAMARLESAYQLVESLLESKTQSSGSTSVSVPQATSDNSAAVSETVIPVRSSAPMPKASVEDSAARWANNEIRIPDSIPPIKQVASVPTGKTPVAEAPRPSPAAPVAPPTPPTPPTPPPVNPAGAPAPVVPTPMQQPVISIAPIATPSVDLPPQTQSSAPKSASIPVKPISKTGDRLKSVSDLPSADSLATSSKNNDPLFTAEVDNGLNQLLSDWVLFKKSGLFGGGPKGVQHPLYLKVKDLQIPILLAGRFEGATQEIKQSITDYMNGWRYEQGIIYEQGETFDHYLRRVIRHIIDLQK